LQQPVTDAPNLLVSVFSNFQIVTADSCFAAHPAGAFPSPGVTFHHLSHPERGNESLPEKLKHNQ
jgi:hypothetical protein